jgi:hypothetical protein
MKNGDKLEQSNNRVLIFIGALLLIISIIMATSSCSTRRSREEGNSEKLIEVKQDATDTLKQITSLESLIKCREANIQLAILAQLDGKLAYERALTEHLQEHMTDADALYLLKSLNIRYEQLKIDIK